MDHAYKLEILKDIFGSDHIILDKEYLAVNDRSYPIIDDVIILLDPAQYTHYLRKRLNLSDEEKIVQSYDFAKDIQFTFGEEWQNFPKILPEHEEEFAQYFDMIDLPDLKNSRVCDLGCGIGRWSFFLKDKCRDLILVDFSEAIYVARKNLKGANNTIFFMGDLKRLPFRNDFADFLFCLGVLHHLPTYALDEVRRLGKYSPALLIYLYYSLDNRPVNFRIIHALVSTLRKLICNIKSPFFRLKFSKMIAILLYLPLTWVGRVLSPIGLSRYVPLYEGYNRKSVERITQDVYDRFFTRIEQRFSKKQIKELENTFSKVIVSEVLPYWHFICKR